MVRRGMLKQVLPAVLSAAMVFTSVPANVLAAEPTVYYGEEADAFKLQEEDADSFEVGEVSATLSFDPKDINKNAGELRYDEAANAISGPYGATYAGIRQQILRAVKVKIGSYTASAYDSDDEVSYKLNDGTADVSAEVAVSGDKAPVGSYKATISCAEKEGLHVAATDVTVNFTIYKAKVYVDDLVRVFPTGTTVKAVKDEQADAAVYYPDQTPVSPLQAMAFSVANTPGGTAMSDDVSLAGNAEYYLHADVTLTEDDAKNYEVDTETTDVKLIVGPKQDGIVTIAKPPVAKTYDTAPVEITPDSLGAAVTYDVGGKDTTLAGVVFRGEWRDGAGDGRVLTEPPVNAGYYVYRLYYTDATHTVVDSDDDDSVYYDVPVTINPAKITVTPTLATGAKIYDGATLTDADIATLVSGYTVKNAAGEDKTADFKSEYAFGSAYNYESRWSTQAYEPVFAIYKGTEKQDPGDETKKVTVWTPVEDEPIEIAEGVSYALGFSGYVAIYDANGGRSNTIDVDNVLQNYTVDNSYQALTAAGAALTVEGSGEVTINVDAIQIGGKGNSLANTYTKDFDGEQLYADRAAYKKGVATVSATQAATIAQGTELTYQWQKVDAGVVNDLFRLYKEVDKDATGLVEPVEEPKMPADTTDEDAMRKYYAEVAYYRAWNEGSFNYNDDLGRYHYYSYDKWENIWYRIYGDTDKDGEWRTFGRGTDMVSPRTPGFYRLKVTYKDPRYGASKPGYVYYTIRKKNAMATLTGTLSTYAGTKVQDFVYGITRDKVALALYEATVTETGAATAGAAIELTEEELKKLEKDYSKCFVVQRKNEYPGATEEAQWYTYYNRYTGSNIEFEASTDYVTYSYRLVFSGTDAAGILSYYNFGNKLGIHNELIESGFFTYTGSALDITVQASEARPLTIKIDGTLEKTYDGKPVDTSAIKIVAMDGDKDVTAQVKMNVRFNGMDAKYAVHGGRYDLYVYTDGDATYASSSAMAVYTIKKKELTLVPEFAGDPVTAGKYVWENGYSEDGDIVKAWRLEDATQLAEGDKDIFDETLTASMIVPTTGVWEDDVRHVLRSDETYLAKPYKYDDDDGVWPWTSRYDENLMENVSYFDDYQIADSTTPFVVKKAPARVEGRSGDRDDTCVTEDNYATYKHTIKPVAAINCNGHKHWYYVYITAPTEISAAVLNNGYGLRREDFSYKAAIEAIGGEVLDSIPGDTASYIRIRFDADDASFREAPKDFQITWKPGYIEYFTVDLTEAELLEDLTLAVDPKTLKFGAVNKKMTVGDVQQLDVKITKKKMADIIWLGYESSDPTVLKVTNSKVGDAEISDVDDPAISYNGAGYVTAVKPGKAEVTVYARRRVYDKDGNETDEEVLTKKAKITITVIDITAPKIAKVTAHDTYAVVDYEKPANGYRREVYVFKGSVSADDAEAKVAAVTNGIYGDEFAYQAIYNSDCADYTEGKKKTVYHALVGSDSEVYEAGMLAPSTEYTVYVRNVTGVKTLEDGTKVALSAKGSVKSFKTTAQEIDGIVLTAADPARAYDAKLDKVSYDYYVSLDDRKVTLTPAAIVYSRKTADSAAEGLDNKTVQLADLGDGFVTTKIAYAVIEPFEYQGWNVTIPEAKFKKYCQDRNLDKATKKQYKYFKTSGGKVYYKTSSLATVNKNGDVTLKGKGIANILAYDTVSGAFGICDLFIDATPDNLSGTKKPVKLAVGEEVDLTSLLTYKKGSKKLADYNSNRTDYYYYYDDEDSEYFWKDVNATWTDLSLDAAALAEQGLEITRNEGYNDFGQHYSYYLVKALEESVNATLTVTDEIAGKSCSIKIATPKLAPVKKLTTTFVADERVTFAWKYPVITKDFRIEILDADKKIVYSTVVSGDEDGFGRKLKNTDKEFTFVFGLRNPGNDSDYLVRKSKYTARVTVLSTNAKTKKAVESKAKSKPFKTTDVPASYRNLSHESWGAKKSALSYGGMPVKVVAGSADNKITVNGQEVARFAAARNLTDNALLTGNTYTLYASLNGSLYENPEAERFMSDKLTWKSSNSKVAKIKTLKGSFSARLNTKAAGTTNITVTSKVTKKTIANWTVTVVPVGDATNFYGENEPYGRSTSHLWQTYKPENIPSGEILGVTLGSAVESDVNAGERKWFVFTAPSDGYYDANALFYDTNGVNGDYEENTFSGDLRRGQKIYMSALNPSPNFNRVRLEVKAISLSTAIDTVGETIINANKNYVFYAPETNYYTMSLKRVGAAGDPVPMGGHGLNKGESYNIVLPANSYGDYQLTITKRNVGGALSSDAEVDITVPYDGIWYTFTAAESGMYDFSFTTESDDSFTIGRYATILSGNVAGIYALNKSGATTLKNVLVSAGNPTVFSLEFEGDITDKTKTAAVKAAKVVKSGGVAGDLTGKNSETITVSKTAPALYTYTANGSGIYRFSADNSNVQIIGADGQNKKIVDGGVFLTDGEDVNIVITADNEDPAEDELTIETNDPDGSIRRTFNVNANTDITASPLQSGWYKLRIQRSGDYFYGVNGAEGQVEVKEIKVNDEGPAPAEEMSWNKEGSAERTYNAGDVVYLGIDAGGSDFGLSLYSTKFVVNANYSGIEYQHSTTTNSFTVKKSGYYDITMDRGNFNEHQDVYVILYVNGMEQASKNYYGEGNDYTGEHFNSQLLNAGDVVYYRVVPYYNESYPKYNVNITTTYTDEQHYYYGGDDE